MQIKLFYIGIEQYEEDNEQLNKFLRSKKIVHVESSMLSTGTYCGWLFTVRYLDNTVNNNYYRHTSGGSSDKIDYKNVLDEKTFEQFSKLREVRKKIASDEAIPAYAVFTNEELSKIAKANCLDENDLIKIEGIGDKRVEKYGKMLFELLKQ